MTIPSVLVVAMVRDAAEGGAVVVAFLAVMVLVLVDLAGDEILLLAVAGALFALLLPPFIYLDTKCVSRNFREKTG